MEFNSTPAQELRAYLCKKGHVVKNWKLRLFVLKPGSNFMEYFVDESKESIHQSKGKVPLYGCKVGEYTHNSSNNPREYCFIVEGSSGKSWIVSASSKVQQMQWINAIKEAATQAEETDDVKYAKHKFIEKQLANDVKARSKVPILKLLLLGTGESGKSTIVKQMKILHHHGFTKEEEEFYKHLIFRNLLDGVALMVHVIKENKIFLPDDTMSAINNFKSWYHIYLERRPPTIRTKYTTATTSSLAYSPTPTPTPPLSPNHSPPHKAATLTAGIDITRLSITDTSSSSTSSSLNSNGAATTDNALLSTSPMSMSMSTTGASGTTTTTTTKAPHTRSNSDNGANTIFNVQDFGIPPIITNYISIIWSDPIVQTEVMQKAQRYHINESTQYYLNEVKRIGKTTYLPTNMDILKSRATTNGVVETDFKVADVIFRIVDVAGQRGERKKWINFFDDVTAIIFVAAINEYDQTLVEDNCTNRLQESLNLFDQVCNDKTFPNTSIILFMNKIDLFREKLKRVSIKTCFSEYQDDQSYEKSSNYIKNSFLTKKRGQNTSKHIYYHFTCATDTKSFEAVFNSVQDIIISKTLELYC
ncbi:hypothetical protein CYY_003281 [Polysphondylium violaceum]|uniref:PH domain-containing protein n=1 Tax=Polysphondylium violaceum TaxID=133409 RepID=A0A8J4PZS0_9MYCE|nr:hypothetical protein CYY_003281 [Polysphondylium violaceum]